MTGEHEIRLVGFPLRVWLAAQEHHEELMREFALLAMASATGSDVPLRLLALVEELTQRFAGSAQAVEAARDAAVERGEEFADLVYRAPREAREASIALDRMLEEADDFCRAGERLLTLATPHPALAFRRWYLAELVRQIDGLPPRPWPGVGEALAIDVAAALA